MTPSRLPLTLWRNDDPYRVRFNISEDGVPLDMTAHDALMHVRLRPGAPGDPLLAISTVATADGSVITLDDEGFELVIYRQDILPPPDTDFTQDTVEAADFEGSYDILITTPEGDTNPWYYGDFVIKEWVTVTEIIS